MLIGDAQQIANEETLRRNMEKLRHELGSIICNALDDKEVIEIMVNPDGHIWIDRLSYGMENTGKKISPERLLAALGTIAAMLRTELNKNSPILEGELPLDGSRVEGVIPPVVKSASMSIRKHSSAVLKTKQGLKRVFYSVRFCSTLVICLRMGKTRQITPIARARARATIPR